MSNIPVVSPSVNQILIGQQPQVDQSQLTTPMIGTPVINQNLINCQFQVTDQSQMALQQTGVAAALGQNLIGQAQTVNQLPMVIPQQYQYTAQPQLLASQNMLIGNQQGGMLLDQLGLSTSSVVPGMLLGQQGVSPSVVMPGVSVPAMMPGASPSPLMPGISLALPGLSQSPLLPGLPVGQPGVSLSAMMPGISLGQPGVSTQSLMPGMPLGQPGMSPSALMLPNGQIIPVVTQPELLFPSITPLVSSKGETTAVYQNVVSAVTTTSDVPPQQQSKKATPTRPILPKPAQGCPQAAPVAPVTGGLIVAQNVVAPSVINQLNTSWTTPTYSVLNRPTMTTRLSPPCGHSSTPLDLSRTEASQEANKHDDRGNTTRLSTNGDPLTQLFRLTKGMSKDSVMYNKPYVAEDIRKCIIPYENKPGANVNVSTNRTNIATVETEDLPQNRVKGEPDVTQMLNRLAVPLLIKREPLDVNRNCDPSQKPELPEDMDMEDDLLLQSQVMVKTEPSECVKMTGPVAGNNISFVPPRGLQLTCENESDDSYSSGSESNREEAHIPVRRRYTCYPVGEEPSESEPESPPEQPNPDDKDFTDSLEYQRAVTKGTLKENKRRKSSRNLRKTTRGFSKQPEPAVSTSEQSDDDGGIDAESDELSLSDSSFSFSSDEDEDVVESGNQDGDEAGDHGNKGQKDENSSASHDLDEEVKELKEQTVQIFTPPDVNPAYASWEPSVEDRKGHLQLGIRRIFPCDRCSKEMCNIGVLRLHYRRKHAKGEEPSSYCDYCQIKLYPFETKFHQCCAASVCSYEGCQVVICTRKQRRSHRDRHRRGRRKKKVCIKVCHVCGKQFRYQSCLDAHLRIHTGEKPFVCYHCGAAFRQKASWNYHMQKHHPEDKEWKQVKAHCDWQQFVRKVPHGDNNIAKKKRKKKNITGDSDDGKTENANMADIMEDTKADNNIVKAENSRHKEGSVETHITSKSTNGKQRKRGRPPKTHQAGTNGTSVLEGPATGPGCGGKPRKRGRPPRVRTADGEHQENDMSVKAAAAATGEKRRRRGRPPKVRQQHENKGEQPDEQNNMHGETGGGSDKQTVS